MNARRIATAITAALGLAALLATGSALPQQATPRNYKAEIEKAVRAAKTAAEFDFLGTLVRTCLLPQSSSEDTSDRPASYVTDPSTAPPRDTWYSEPAKVFDNFYFIGGKVHSAWVLQTREGLILFDTIYPYNSEELVLGGMKKLGLDPRDIKYMLISHAHGDHIGGAQMMQERYAKGGMRTVMGGPDWDWVEKYPNRYKGMAPKRDITAVDGMTVKLGEATVYVMHTPGHTPGTLSYTFDVRDKGRVVHVAYSGGTAFNFVNDKPDPGIRNFQIYIDSQKRFAAHVAATGATVLISNHSEFDMADTKNKMLAGRGDGPHPYEQGAAAVQRYFQVTQNCARAGQLRLEQRQATGG